MQGCIEFQVLLDVLLGLILSRTQETKYLSTEKHYPDPKEYSATTAADIRVQGISPF